MSDAPELKPCPFCGGAAEIIETWTSEGFCSVTCQTENCMGRHWEQDEQGGFSSEHETHDAAVAAWNRRADLDAAKDARIADLEDKVRSLTVDLDAANDRANRARMQEERKWQVVAADLTRQLAEAREVKPLEWREYPDQGFWRADTVIGEYSVGFDDGWWAQLEGVEFWEWNPPDDSRSYSGPATGMNACKADYEARILSALKGAKP